MANTTKPLSSVDHTQALKGSFNEQDASLAVSGFLAAKVGRKVTLVQATLTDTYTYSESGITLYVILLTYTDSTKATLSTAERSA